MFSEDSPGTRLRTGNNRPQILLYMGLYFKTAVVQIVVESLSGYLYIVSTWQGVVLGNV